MPAVDLSSENSYARRRKQLLSLIKDLRAIGAHTHLDLPRIVVIGNQSAGKSSLIEAISGIKVPRDAGTCTRCPMECRLLSSTGRWSCQVSIRWEYHPNGERRSKIEEETFGNLLTEKAEVEMMLRRAQAAVLNPKTPTSRFVVMTDSELSELSPRDRPDSTPFSQNVVCVDIAGPDLTDLSFVDLPGIIQNADEHVVQFVEHMVRSYISGTCLIVVALPMSDDIENQRALRLAREADRNGLRTIGVMTKPDTLGPGSIKAKDLWLDIMEGRSQAHYLRHGYYCTRQPDDADRAAGIMPSEAREAEARFFKETAPWSTSAQQGRFGTNNLVKYMSSMLTEIINGVIPRLGREIDEKLATCYEELKSLPPQITGEPASYVLTLLSSFCVDVQSHIIGGPGTETLVQHNRRVYEDFKRAIRSTAPRFIPLPSAEDTAPKLNGQERAGPEDEDGLEDVLQDGSGADSMYLKDMRLHIQRSVTRELPFNVPYPAKTALIRSFQALWEQQSQACFDRVQGQFRATLTQIMHTRLGRFKKLEVKVDSAVAELLVTRHTAALEQIGILLKFETSPFTQNNHYLSDVTAKTLSRYKDIREGKTQSGSGRSAASFHFGKSPDNNGAREVGNPFARFVDMPIQFLPHPLVPSGPIADKVDFGLGQKAIEPGSSDHSSRRREKQMPRAKTAAKRGSTAPTTDEKELLSEESAGDETPEEAAPGFGAWPGKNPKAASTESTVGTPAPVPFSKPFPGFTGFNSQPATPSQRQQATSDLATSGGNERSQLEMDALSALAKLGYVGLTADDLGKLNPPDEYEEELNVMAEVRAYFQVAYKRIIDYIPLAIDHMFLFAFGEALQTHLIRDLALGSPDAAARCSAYLSEELDVVARRQELSGKKTSLERAKMELLNATFDKVVVVVEEEEL